MFKNVAWDFECPQYVDFEKELDNSVKDDVFFDCKEKNPENESLCKTPAIQDKAKGLSESDENRLMDKMNAALSILENTPKIRKNVPRGKLFSEKFAKGICPKVIKSTIKPSTVPALPQRSRRSKSLTHLSKINPAKTNKRKEQGLCRSSSMDDLRIYKKSKYPVTPMCLKRTIVKAKERVIKTTEERELEEIKKLQQQLKQHLRQNEISLKKLNLKPRQGAILKTVSKCDNLKEPKGVSVLAENGNIAEKESKRDIRMLNHSAVKKVAAELDNIMNPKSAKNKRINSMVCSSKPKTTIDCDLSKSIMQKTKKLSHNRILDHSGIIFLPSVKSSSIVKPFIFEAKVKEVKLQIAAAKSKEMSVYEVLNDKENIPYGNKSAAKKTQEIQNGKCDNKLVESNKTTGKQAANPLRGVPFAENFTRN